MSDTVKIAGQTLDLSPPRRLWHRHALQVALGECQSIQGRLQVSAAALALCAPDLQAKRGAPVYRDGELGVYGAAVLDYLLAHGAAPDEIWPAASIAINLVLESIPTASEHETAAGNSEAPSGA